MESFDNLILTKTKNRVVEVHLASYPSLTIEAGDDNVTPTKFPYVSMRIIGDVSIAEDFSNNENAVALDVEWTTYMNGTTKRTDCKNIMGTIHDKMRSYGAQPRQRPLYIPNADTSICRMQSKYHLIIGENHRIQ